MRGLGKAEAPGLLDLPAAGHVLGVESVEKALCRELREERGVTLDTVDGLTALGRYDYADPADGVSANVENLTVYRGRLSQADWLRLGAGDEELLAVALIPVKKLPALVAAHPERVASGLRGSLALYAQG